MMPAEIKSILGANTLTVEAYAGSSAYVVLNGIAYPKHELLAAIDEADKDQLNAEAKALYEHADPSWAQHRPWDPDTSGANVWIRAAQKAREIHGKAVA